MDSRDQQPHQVTTPALVNESTLSGMNLQIIRQVAPWRWQSSLALVQRRLEQGATFEEAFHQAANRMPAALRSLCLQALMMPDPTRALVELMLDVQEQQRRWREFWGVLAYPLTLAYLSVAIVALFGWVLPRAFDFDWIADLQLRSVEGLVVAVNSHVATSWGIVLFALWILAVGGAVQFLGSPAARLAILSGIAFIGRPLRYMALAALLRRMALFFQSGMGGIQAVEAWARSFGGSELEWTAHHVARRVAGGTPIGQALADSMFADRVTIPIMFTIDKDGKELTGRIQQTAALLERLRQDELAGLRRIIPPVLVLFVVVMLWGVLLDYVSLILLFLQVITGLV